LAARFTGSFAVRWDPTPLSARSSAPPPSRRRSDHGHRRERQTCLLRFTALPASCFGPKSWGWKNSPSAF